MLYAVFMVAVVATIYKCFFIKINKNYSAEKSWSSATNHSIVMMFIFFCLSYFSPLAKIGVYLSFGLLAFNFSMFFMDRIDADWFNTFNKKGKILHRIVTMCIIALFPLNYLKSIDIHEGGVQYGYGGQIIKVLKPGLHFIPPWNSLEIFDCTIKKYSPLEDPNSDAAGIDNAGLSCSLRDQQTLYIRPSIYYQINPDKLDQYRRQITKGTSYEAQILKTHFPGALKEEVAKYSANNILGHRGKIQNDILPQFTSHEKQYGVDVQCVVINTAAFNTGLGGYEQKILDKSIERQSAKESRLETIQAGVKAQDTTVKRKTSADKESLKQIGVAKKEATIEQAKAESEKYILVAQGYKAKQIRDSISPIIIMYLASQKYTGNVPPYIIDGNNSLVDTVTGLLQNNSQASE